MAKDDIYGAVPDGGADSVVAEALKELGTHSGNKINGPIASKDSDYPEKD